jgi:hypothetical protein
MSPRGSVRREFVVKLIQPELARTYDALLPARQVVAQAQETSDLSFKRLGSKARAQINDVLQ